MPAVARLNDLIYNKKLGNIPLVEGSSSVFANGKPVGRIGDRDSTSTDYISNGSSSVFVNGKSVGRVGDPTASGGYILTGSPNVFIG